MSDIIERLLMTRDCTVCDGDGIKSNGKVCGGCEGDGRVLRFGSIGTEAADEIKRLRALSATQEQVPVEVATKPLEADSWFSQVVSFLVKHDMLDARDEYDISDVMGALADNYEPMLVNAVQGIADDYMTSENHHPGYVLIPTEKFDAIRVALAASEDPKE